MRKTFVIAAKSSNFNSFGLRGIVMVAGDGEVWQAATNTLNEPQHGERLSVPLSPFDHSPMWHGFGFEIPERLDDAPPSVVAECFQLPDPNEVTQA